MKQQFVENMPGGFPGQGAQKQFLLPGGRLSRRQGGAYRHLIPEGENHPIPFGEEAGHGQRGVKPPRQPAQAGASEGEIMNGSRQADGVFPRPHLQTLGLPGPQQLFLKDGLKGFGRSPRGLFHREGGERIGGLFRIKIGGN